MSSKTGDEAVRCPQCRAPMALDEPAMCTVCGWVSLAEVRRQIAYWQRRLAAHEAEGQ